MIPEKIKFTGLEIDPNEILYSYGGRKVEAPYPSTWQRLEFTVIPNQAFVHTPVFGQASRPGTKMTSEQLINTWLYNNIHSKWGSYLDYSRNVFVIFFAEDDDAVLFRLLDGHTVSLINNED